MTQKHSTGPPCSLGVGWRGAGGAQGLSSRDSSAGPQRPRGQGALAAGWLGDVSVQRTGRGCRGCLLCAAWVTDRAWPGLQASRTPAVPLRAWNSHGAISLLQVCSPPVR